MTNIRFLYLSLSEIHHFRFHPVRGFKILKEERSGYWTASPPLHSLAWANACESKTRPHCTGYPSAKRCRLILFKIDAKCSLGCLGSSCGGSLFNFYSKLMPNAPWAALAPSVVVPLFNSYQKMMPNAPWAVLAPPVVVPCSILIQN